MAKEIIRNSFVITALVFLAASSAITSRAQAAGNKVPFESELRAIYPKLDKALKTKNLVGVTGYYDKSYTLDSDGKRLDRAQAIDQWKSLLGFLKQIAKLTTKIEKVSQSEDKYIIDYSQTSSGQVQFPGSPVLPFTYTGKITDTWTRSAKGVWKTISSVEHVSDFKVNGETSRPPN